MGDGFATVDKGNLKSTGMSESLNPTMTTDYRLRCISILQHKDLSQETFSVLYSEILLFTIMPLCMQVELPSKKKTADNRLARSLIK